MKNGMIENADGSKVWYLNGKKHREDGPAVEYAYGTKAWYLNGKLHREDGPAVEYADGYKEWYLNGKKQKSESENKTEVKDMSISEIEKKLGYRIRIVKE